jgi:hypothetical protein
MPCSVDQCSYLRKLLLSTISAKNLLDYKLDLEEALDVIHLKNG